MCQRGRGRRRGGDADAEMAAEAGAWCVPARPAARRGSGADEPWACSQVEAIVASIVSNVEGSPRSRPRSPGVCQPARTCGESSIPPLLSDFADFVFARRTQVTTSSMMRRCSTPTTRRIRSPFSSRRGRRRTPSARVVGAGGGHGYGRPEMQETPPMRLAVTAERERMGTVISIGVQAS